MMTCSLIEDDVKFKRVHYKRLDGLDGTNNRGTTPVPYHDLLVQQVVGTSHDTESQVQVNMPEDNNLVDNLMDLVGFVEEDL